MIRDQITLSTAATDLGWKPFRLKQVWHAREMELATSWATISTLPLADRDFLTARVPFDSVVVEKKEISADGTAVKFLLVATDGKKLETVLLLHSGTKKKWGTVCVSSQVGCPVGCRFCATGAMGFARHLSTEEILDQWLIAKRTAAKLGVTDLNIVFMGMGEPLLNLGSVLPALRIFTDPTRYGLSPSRITISTSGILAGLDELYAGGIKVGLALSLHAADSTTRTRLMPINATQPLAQVLEKLKKWEQRGTEVLIEYVLINGVNDSPAAADQLIELLKKRKVKINLIPLNPIPRSTLAKPGLAKMRAFLARLESAGLAATLRHTKGADIQAACGQLATQAD